MWEQEIVNVKELGKFLYLDSGTLTPLLRKLEEKEYITRDRFEEDERNLVISITDKGMELRKKAKDIPKKIGSCINLTDKETIELYRLLYKILKNQ